MLCGVTTLRYGLFSISKNYSDFAHQCGGHLVLWDLWLVIKISPGATILIPSEILRPANITIQPGESWYSVTQYTAGGLFCWVDQGMQPTGRFLELLSDEEWEEYITEAKARWVMGISLFSTLTTLQQQPNLDKV